MVSENNEFDPDREEIHRRAIGRWETEGGSLDGWLHQEPVATVAVTPTIPPPSGVTAPPTVTQPRRDCTWTVSDVTVADGTLVNPGQTFTKTSSIDTYCLPTNFNDRVVDRLCPIVRSILILDRSWYDSRVILMLISLVAIG